VILRVTAKCFSKRPSFNFACCCTDLISERLLRPQVASSSTWSSLSRDLTSQPVSRELTLLSSPFSRLLQIPIIPFARYLQTNLDTPLHLCQPSFPLPTVNIRRLGHLTITQHLSSSFVRLSLFACYMYELCSVSPSAVLK
jgi:hypothetical protein